MHSASAIIVNMASANSPSDQSLLWGYSVASWDKLGIWALVIGAILGVVALLLTAASAYVLYRVADTAQVALEDESRTAKIEIAEANAKIAEAGARQKEAELKLEQLRRQVAPRQLQRDKFINDLLGQPSAPVEIMYLMDDPECFDLAQQIWRALEDAKWPVSPPKPIPPLVLSDDPTPMSVGGQPSGVTVVVKVATREESEAAANALAGKDWVKTPWTVLSHAIGEGLGRIATHAGSPFGPEAGALRVVVAPR